MYTLFSISFLSLSILTNAKNNFFLYMQSLFGNVCALSNSINVTSICQPKYYIYIDIDVPICTWVGIARHIHKKPSKKQSRGYIKMYNKSTFCYVT